MREGIELTEGVKRIKVYLMEFRTEWKLRVHRVDEETAGQCRVCASLSLSVRACDLTVHTALQTQDTDSVHVVQRSVVQWCLPVEGIRCSHCTVELLVDPLADQVAHLTTHTDIDIDAHAGGEEKRR